MSKIICGFSESDAIMFSSKTTKIVVSENGKIEYAEMISKARTKNLNELKYPVKKIHVAWMAIEIAFMIVCLILSLEILTIAGCLVSILFNSIMLVKVNKHFYKDPKLRSNHGAEHMVFNAYRKHEAVTVAKIRKSSKYTRFCGSVKLSNMVFLEIINCILAFKFGIFIPHVALLFLSFNFNSAVPFNFIAYVQQKFITSEPNENSLFMAHLAHELVLQSDLLKEKGLFSESEFNKKLLDVLDDMSSSNDYNMKEVTFIKT